jgi:hypothetical protein
VSYIGGASVKRVVCPCGFSTVVNEAMVGRIVCPRCRSAKEVSRKVDPALLRRKENVNVSTSK